MRKKRKLKNKLIVILGPTATGKTKLAVKLAKKFKGEIVSADSRQVYKGMNIGAGKDLQEYGKIPHHLIDLVSPKRRFTLAQYQAKAYREIDDILRRGKIPFLVGGSGLYLDSVVKGLILPSAKPDLKLRQHLQKKSLLELQALAKKYNLNLNESDFKNKRRLIRKIEIRSTGIAGGGKALPRYNCLILGLTLPKNELVKRIKARLNKRLEQGGLIQEVKKLKASGLSWKKLDSFGLEYRFVAKYLQNELTYGEMADKLAVAIGRFAKRQMTWFKRDKNIVWLKNAKQARNLIKIYPSYKMCPHSSAG